MGIASIILPFAGWYGSQAYVADVAARDPVPNQDAMLLAFLAFCLSCLLALGLFIGACVLLVVALADARRSA